ncbi:hypothetical protein BDN72DRAFT_956179 [Pluteus cervinus]|uniref:Uncharacterized protein n=1 Tax=Pluteus cervinus TaxID=181527 RepID=A0ACD3B6T8_9AGAR|nr:hypothetical protein BDN72DRAFT_956179 [Pluteus cervinus]
MEENTLQLASMAHSVLGVCGSQLRTLKLALDDRPFWPVDCFLQTMENLETLSLRMADPSSSLVQSFVNEVPESTLPTLPPTWSYGSCISTTHRCSRKTIFPTLREFRLTGSGLFVDFQSWALPWCQLTSISITEVWMPVSALLSLFRLTASTLQNVRVETLADEDKGIDEEEHNCINVISLPALRTMRLYALSSKDFTQVVASIDLPVVDLLCLITDKVVTFRRPSRAWAHFLGERINRGITVLQLSPRLETEDVHNIFRWMTQLQVFRLPSSRLTTEVRRGIAMGDFGTKLKMLNCFIPDEDSLHGILETLMLRRIKHLKIQKDRKNAILHNLSTIPEDIGWLSSVVLGVSRSVSSAEKVVKTWSDMLDKQGLQITMKRYGGT